MKFREISKSTVQPYHERHKTPGEKKDEQIRIENEKKQLERVAKMLRDQQLKEERVAKNVKDSQLEKALENIEWREMRFYRHYKDGLDYIDIVDRVSGETLKTIPAPDFYRLGHKFRDYRGVLLDISG